MKNTLLLVDDEPNILKSLSRVFDEEGYEIFTAGSPEEALDLLKNQNVDVIISDQRMPTMTGSEFLSRVKKQYPDTIRMILSGYADFNAIQSAINEGSIYKFLNKPWDNDELKKNVYEAFKQHTLNMKHKEQEQELTVLLKFDKLTGLLNRFSFIQSLTDAIQPEDKETTSFALMLIDIQHLSQINNEFGQEFGDQIILEISNRLKIWADPSYLISRLGGDEFAIVIFTDIKNKKFLETTIVELCSFLRQPFNINDSKIIVGSNLGISLYPTDANTSDPLIKCAKLALLKNQAEAGKDCQFYDVSLEKGITTSIQLETDLHQALEKNEFRLLYQPMVNQSGYIMGVEALLRWNHSKHGILSPDKFLSIAETTGLILPIGKWVLQTAIKQLKIWHDMGYSELQVAVNISANQFRDPNLYQYVSDALKTFNISPTCLILEITETLIMNNIEINTTLLKSLREIGVKIAMDDFGTGYSSLKYLNTLPINILKIDQSFVREMLHSKNTADIVITIIALGKNLNLAVLAEGVETKEQQDFLINNHCELLQGYLFSSPDKASEITKKLLQQFRI